MSDIRKSREIYLNDHLAGAKGALDLLEDMTESDDQRLAALARELHEEISKDRDQLEAVMDRLDVSRKRATQAMASLAESASWLAVARVGAPDTLSRLQQLEALSGGIWTKKRLWLALAAAPELRRTLAGIDLDDLQSRADRQLDRVEAEHRRIAAEALQG